MGHGEDDSSVVAGSVFAIACTVCMCILGIPLVLAGIVMVFFGTDTVYAAGVIILIISCLLTVGGIVMVVFLCKGGCKRTPRQATIQTTQLIMQGAPATVVGQYPLSPVAQYPGSIVTQYPAAPVAQYPAAAQPTAFTSQTRNAETYHLLQYQGANSPDMTARPPPFNPDMTARPPPFNPHYTDDASTHLMHQQLFPSAPPPYEEFGTTPAYASKK